MKIKYALLIIMFVLASGCLNATDQNNKDAYSCETNNDCIPRPGCHPHECINKGYENLYEHQDFCTELFDCSAAYKQEDCLCIENKCVNKNLDNKGCQNMK